MVEFLDRITGHKKMKDSESHLWNIMRFSKLSDDTQGLVVTLQKDILTADDRNKYHLSLLLTFIPLATLLLENHIHYPHSWEDLVLNVAVVLISPIATGILGFRKLNSLTTNRNQQLAQHIK